MIKSKMRILGSLPAARGRALGVLFIAAATLAASASASQAQVELKTYADAKGYLNVRTLDLRPTRQYLPGGRRFPRDVVQRLVQWAHEETFHQPGAGQGRHPPGHRLLQSQSGQESRRRGRKLRQGGEIRQAIARRAGRPRRRAPRAQERPIGRSRRHGSGGSSPWTPPSAAPPHRMRRRPRRRGRAFDLHFLLAGRIRRSTPQRGALSDGVVSAIRPAAHRDADNPVLFGPGTQRRTRCPRSGRS